MSHWKTGPDVSIRSFTERRIMPINVKRFSETGYMHIYSRGVGKQILFEDHKDYIFYLNLLKRFSQETNVRICAFCLMENHVHLIIYDEQHHISQFMQLLGMAYSGYYNRRYKRSGHLFSSRYLSVPIEDEDYLLTAFRYVLNNPRKANLCPASEYPWSSYSRYGHPESFVDTSAFQELLGSREEYEEFIAAKYEDCPELEDIIHDDEWAKSVIREVLQVQSGTELQKYDWETRNQALRLLKEKGLSIRQIERLTGISRSVVQRA